MRSFAPLAVSTLLISACSSAPIDRMPASEVAEVQSKAPEATPAPARNECRNATPGDVQLRKMTVLKGKLTKNPIAQKILEDQAAVAAMKPRQLEEIKRVLYVMIPERSIFVRTMDEKPKRACRPQAFTLAIESETERERAEQAYQQQKTIRVTGQAAWPETSVELVDNGLLDGAKIL